MNLQFSFVQNVERDGEPCALERADVTKDANFWRVWRSPAAEAVKKLIYLTPDGTKWYAYRLKPLNKENTYVPFNLVYQVKNQSRLLPYQIRAVSHLVQSIIDNGSACDGSDTGLGKTYHALAAARELSLSPVILCRRAGISGWKKVCRYLGVIPLCVANWEAYRTCKIHVNGKKILTKEKRHFRSGYDFTWHLPKGALLIFDEAHMGFNVDSQNHALWTAAEGRTTLSLSATFADRPARLEGLFRVLRIMDSEAFSKWLLERGHFTNQYNENESLTAVEDMKEINKVLYPKYGCRISYEDEEVKKFFPSRVIQTEIVDLGTSFTMEQNAEYAKLLEKARLLKEMGKQAELLVADLRYRQHAELLKVKTLAEMAHEYMYEGKSVVIFVNFRETMRYLAEALSTKSLIFGDQERYGIDRDDTIEKFQNGTERILVCMAEAGGQSISLHDTIGGSQRISLICPTYNPISLQQILGRTYRAGSKTIPIMKLVYAAGTVEEKVAETVNKKLDNIAALNDGDLMETDLFQLGSN